jgi:hypothetical protein
MWRAPRHRVLRGRLRRHLRMRFFLSPHPEERPLGRVSKGEENTELSRTGWLPYRFRLSPAMQRLYHPWLEDFEDIAQSVLKELGLNATRFYLR